MRGLQKKQRWAAVLVSVLMALVLLLTGCGAAGSSAAGGGTGSTGSASVSSAEGSADQDSAGSISEDGTYTSKDDVALYLHLYGHLPSNFITKSEARDLGWDSSLGNLDEVAPGMSIGGERFGNYEGSLPEKSGRRYYECDVDYSGGYRGAERIIYSSDGLIYYTEDHYRTFERLY